ncbi:uncharacterized protein LOC144554349 [Carex rostrata]
MATASGLISSIQSISTNLLRAIRGTPSTSHQQQDPPSPVTDQQISVIKDLEKLSRMLARIQAVQQDAEEREIHDRSVRLWLEELRGVGYQAEDVLDEFYYEVQRSIVESGDAAIEAYHRGGGTKRKIAEMYASSSLASCSVTKTKASIPDGMAEKIKGITESFEEISNARRDLHLREEDGTRLVIGPQIRPPTSSHVDERAIFGREKDKEKIISLLNPSTGPDFMVLPIVGMGGFGKTTLAQLVFNDSRIHGLFNRRCWVCVSDDFDLVRLTKAIIDSLSEKPCEFSELSKLQDVLKEKISGHGLFLVLDDVWNEQRNLWECFRVGFLGAKFVRILMTTRNTSVAKIMQTTSPFQLSSLPEENCWSLFKHFAFGSRETSENANLHEIGRGIVKKCKGSPLAIKALGGILRYEMNEEKWREILESDMSEIDETGEVMPALRLSYQKLPQHLKPCFLYLSMFPKDTKLVKDKVVRLWMAQGYINGNTRNLRTLEEIGSEYFDELQGRSLVDGGPSFYILHDLIHDLARSVSQEAYWPVLENDQEYNGPCKVCHLYFTKHDELLGLVPNNYWSIRTFSAGCRSKNFDFDKFLVPKYTCARALDLTNARALDLTNFLLPNTLGTLKHLRYLYVEDNKMEVIPETLCLLYNLQTLVLDCDFVGELPENMKNLSNLRYFELYSNEIQHLPESIFPLPNLHTLLIWCDQIKELPRGIEQSTRLHILGIPDYLTNVPSGIGKLPTLQQIQGGYLKVMDHEINGWLRELKDMNKLRGPLCISGLRNIVDVELCKNANLASKPNLHELFLNFQEDCVMQYFRDGKGKEEEELYDAFHLHLSCRSSNNAKSENDEKIHNVVLESLQPHGNLTELRILNYGGRNFPSWLHNPLLPKLTTLTLNFCIEPNYLPPFGQLPHLRFLEISGGNLGDEPRTYLLWVEYDSSKQPKKPSYPSLEELILRNMLNLVEWQANDGDFPSLEMLVLENCPELWKIPTIPQNVRDITFEGCPKLKFLTCPLVISNLEIMRCGFREIMFHSVSENLTISNCIELISINWNDGGLNSVREVSFEHCPKLELVTFPVRALKLKIHECGFREIKIGSILESLTISNCVELMSINWNDGGLNSVREVSFEHCPKLELVTCPVRALKLKIHECGFREIKIGSIPESLTISNCVELMSINWNDEGLNSVREVSFEHCPKLELVTFPVRALKLKIHECGFREIKIGSIPESLTISNCVEVISINWNDGGLNYVREVSFEHCPKLELVTFPVRALKLKIHECGFREIKIGSIPESLTISNCVELMSINWNDGGLNSVREVSFEHCPKLELVTFPVRALKLKIHECGFREIKIGSIPESLTISNCVEVISINWNDGGLNSVREVSFEHCPKLELVTFPVRALKLKIHECGFREIKIGSIPESLTISNCVEVISINWNDGGLNSVREVSFEHCPKLELVTFPVRALKLKIHECGFREIKIGSILESLTISNCVELISINWIAIDLNSFRKVSFEYCPKLELHVPVKDVLHSIDRVEIYDCPRLYLGKGYVYQRDTTIKELNLSGNNKIHLSDSTIPLPENQFKLFLTKEDFREVESLTCAPSVGVSCQHVILNLASLVILEIMRCTKVISVTGLDNLSNLKRLSISSCPNLCNWNDRTLPLSLESLQLIYCGMLSSMPLLSVQNHSSTLKIIVIRKCPRLDELIKRYVYQRDTTIKELNLSGNNDIHLSDSMIPLLDSQFELFLTKKDFQEVESLTCAASVGVSCQHVILNLTSLVILEIRRCTKVISVTGLDNLSNLKNLSISLCPELCNWNDKTLPQSLEFLELDSCDKLSSLPLLSVQNHSSTLEVLVIKKCPRLDELGESCVYQRDTTIKRLNFSGNNEIHLSDSTITLLENQLKLFLTKEDFWELESLTCAPSVGVSCQHVILNLASLVILEIMRCTNIISVTGLDNLSNLKCLSISFCPELCNWNDKTLPLSLKFLELNYCDKLSTMPLLSVQNHSSTLEVLVITMCPRLDELVDFQGLMKLKTVDIRHCRNISISLATESHPRPRINIGDCPLMRDWCQRNNITYNELIGNPQEDREAELESAEHGGGEHESGEEEFGEQESAEIYECPILYLGERYVYQRDTTIKELNLSGNNKIHLSDSTIPLQENQFKLFLTEEDFREVESLTCAPSVGVSCPHIILNLASLVILEIMRCTKVISMTGLDNLSTLKCLSISLCPELCNWNDKTLPLSLKFLELNHCDKLCSLPLLSVQNHSSTLEVLVITKCPRLDELVDFQGLMKLKTVDIRHCRNISISLATESHPRPRINIGDCPLMRDWCQRNNITYNEFYPPIGNPQDDREAEQESAEST